MGANVPDGFVALTVHVVIPVHNHISETLRCIACLKQQCFEGIRIIVVDDGSTDDTDREIASQHDDVVLLKGNGNLWWTGATALGVDHVLQTAGADDFVLMLNNDTEFDADYVGLLVACAQAHRGALVGSLSVDIADPSHVVHAGVVWDWRRMESRRLPRAADATCTTQINTLPGRGTLVPVAVFRRIGNLRCRLLPHYHADYEFACRAARAGFSLVVSYDAVIRVHTAITGSEGDLATPIALRRAVHLLSSRRSIRNLRYRMTFIAIACPGRYRIRNWLAILAATMLLVTNVPPLFHIKNFLFRLLPGKAQCVLLDRKMMAPKMGVDA